MNPIDQARKTLEDLSQALGDAQQARASYYLKIVGKGDEQKVVVVRGRFACLKAFFGCFFGRPSYNTQAVQALIQKSVDIVKSVEIVKGQPLQDVPLHTLLQPLNTAFSPDSKLRNYRARGQVSWTPVVLEALSRSSTPVKEVRKPPPILEKDPTTVFWEGVEPLIHEVFGEDNQISSFKVGADREKQLRTALGKRLDDLVNIPGSNSGRLGRRLWDLKSGSRFWPTYIFRTEGSRENQCYTTVRKKLEADLQEIHKAKKEEMQNMLFHILQAEAFLQVHTENRPLTQEALKARLLLEIEAFATHPLVKRHTEDLQGQLKGSDPAKLSRDDIDQMLSSLAGAMESIPADAKERPMLHAWLNELHRLLVGIQSPQAPLEVVETTEETEEDFSELVQQVREECQEPLLKQLEIDVSKFIREGTTNEADQLLGAVAQADVMIGGIIRVFNERPSVPDSLLKTRISNGLSATEVRKEYKASENNRISRLKQLISFSRRLTCKDYLERYGANSNDLEAKRAVECLDLWDRARERNLPQEHQFWSVLHQDSNFDIKVPPRKERLSQLTENDIQELKKIIEAP